MFDRVLMWIASVSLSLIAKVRFRTRKTQVDSPEPGSIIFCNHTSNWDFALLLYALYPRRDVRFVVSGVQFDKSPFVAWLFKHLGLIRKNQGTHDLVCVKEIIKNVRAGKVVVIYAAGMTSYDGRQAWDALPGSVNLARMLKCPVYVALIHGGFIGRPRHAGKVYRGRQDISVKRLFTSEESAALPLPEAEAQLNAALRFNDWDWQEREHVKFKPAGDLRGANLPLYRCPACGKEGHMKVEKGRIFCPDCGLSAVKDEYGFFVSDSPACPKRMDVWVDMEIEEIRKTISDRSFKLTSSVTLFKKQEGGGDRYFPCDRGTLTMDPDGIRFEGEAPIVLSYKDFQFLVLDDGHFIQINTQDAALRFVFDDGALITKWFFAHRLLCGIEA